MKATAIFLAVLMICGTAQAKSHTVKQGESLWWIAQREYNDGTQWHLIWAANRATIRRPNHIRPGMKLTIPSGHQRPLSPRSDVPTGYRYWKVVKAKLTAYCPCRRCCGRFSNGRTSTGRNAWKPDGCGVDPRVIPYGTLIRIPGVAIRKADDCGPAMRRSARRGIYHIDVRMVSHWKARQWGVRWRTVDLYGKKK